MVFAPSFLPGPGDGCDKKHEPKTRYFISPNLMMQPTGNSKQSSEPVYTSCIFILYTYPEYTSCIYPVYALILYII